MGLCIQGKKTGKYYDRSYSALHFGSRWLALVACGMPLDDIQIPDYKFDRVDNMTFKADPMSLYMDHGFRGLTDIQKYTTAAQMTGFHFPNLMMHSDCEGNYTKNGKDAPNTKNWMGGNSIHLLKELESLCSDKDILKLVEDGNERVKDALSHATTFRDIVKHEIQNGCGTILFR